MHGSVQAREGDMESKEEGLTGHSTNEIKGAWERRTLGGEVMIQTGGMRR